MKKLLRSFNQILEERFIPSRLLEEEDRLTFMLPDLIPETEIYGDITFLPLPEEMKGIRLIRLEFDCMALGPLSPAQKTDLMSASSMLNAAIPMGSFFLAPDKEGVPAELIFHQELLFSALTADKTLLESLDQGFAAACTVLQSAAPLLLSFARGELTKEAFLERL